MDKHIYVNGPMNVVRLENKKLNKVIYIFFDTHLSASSQFRCESIRSTNISEFLVDTFDKSKLKSNKIYDFMIEREPSKALKIDYNKKGKYLDEIIYLFHKSYKMNKGIAVPSEEISNVRFHWTDIRDYILNITYNYVFDYVPEAIRNLENKFNILHVNQFSNIMHMIDGHITFLYEILYETPNLNNISVTKPIFTNTGSVLADFLIKEYQQITENFAYKIIKSYTHKHIQEKIVHIINHELMDIFIKFFELMKTTEVEIDNIRNRLLVIGDNDMTYALKPRKDGTKFYGMETSELDEYLGFFNSVNRKIFKYVIKGISTYIMDLYLLRRFLDKDYVTNTITYTGAGHSVDYIRLLVKYFDFDITNCSYVKDGDITEATNVIKKSDKLEELFELFLEPVAVQCVDMKGFPELFE